MSKFNQHISVALVSLLWLLGFSACNDNNDPQGTGTDSDKVYLMLNVRPLSTRASDPDLVTEMIQSLRIVIIDTDASIIESNHYVPFNGSEESEPVAVNNFQYFYTVETVPGNKRIYLIANEESVGTVSFQSLPGVTLPSGVSGTLSNILNNEMFSEGLDTGATDFMNVLDAVYFTPVYETDENNDIFLPYVSMYEEHTSTTVGTPNSDKEAIQWTTYMVPVATKFSFRFNNYRDNPVYIENITLSEVNNSNFLLARVGTQDQYKDYKDLDGNEYTDVYWVDWLADVARMSQGFTGYYPNLGFNETFGWISAYSVPTTSTLADNVFLNTATDEGIEVPAIGVDGVTPGITDFGPYYLPESFNTITYTTKDENNNDVTVTEQRYSLSILFNQYGQPSSQVPRFEDVTIANLNALFRNTNVVIVVNMNQGDVELYAEIAPWTEKYANGWVVKQ